MPDQHILTYSHEHKLNCSFENIFMMLFIIIMYFYIPEYMWRPGFGSCTLGFLDQAQVARKALLPIELFY